MPVLSDALRDRIKAYFPRYPNKQAVTLPALHAVQDELRCVPLEAVKEIAELLELSPAQVNDTLSFYGFFRDDHHKLGRHRVWICRSLPCMLRGGEELLVHLCEKLALKPGETTSQGRITLEFAECLGACEGAPCALVNDTCHINLDKESAVKLVNELL